MDAQEWTVKQLIETLEQFPPEAKVFYEMGQTAREQLERRST
jgi:hypothetical protein